MKWLGLLALLLALASCANSYKSGTKKDTKRVVVNSKYHITILSTSDIEEALQATKAQR